jgi:hypothetical protein
MKKNVMIIGHVGLAGLTALRLAHHAHNDVIIISGTNSATSSVISNDDIIENSKPTSPLSFNITSFNDDSYIPDKNKIFEQEEPFYKKHYNKKTKFNTKKKHKK